MHCFWSRSVNLANAALLLLRQAESVSPRGAIGVRALS